MLRHSLRLILSSKFSFFLSISFKIQLGLSVRFWIPQKKTKWNCCPLFGGSCFALNKQTFHSLFSVTVTSNFTNIIQGLQSSENSLHHIQISLFSLSDPSHFPISTPASLKFRTVEKVAICNVNVTFSRDLSLLDHRKRKSSDSFALENEFAYSLFLVLSA